MTATQTRIDNRRVAAIACALALATVTLAAAAPAAQAVDRTVAPVPGAGPATWDGPAAVAANVSFATRSYNLSDDDGSCGKRASDYCDQTLIKVDRPGFVEVQVEDVQSNSSGLLFDDFDLFLYSSDAAGTPVDYLTDSSDAPGRDEYVVARVAPGYYLARVVYVSTAIAGYAGSARVTAAAEPAPVAAAAPPAPAAAAAPARPARPAKARRRSCRASKRAQPRARRGARHRRAAKRRGR